MKEPKQEQNQEPVEELEHRKVFLIDGVEVEITVKLRVLPDRSFAETGLVEDLFVELTLRRLGGDTGYMPDYFELTWVHSVGLLRLSLPEYLNLERYAEEMLETVRGLVHPVYGQLFP